MKTIVSVFGSLDPVEMTPEDTALQKKNNNKEKKHQILISFFTRFSWLFAQRITIIHQSFVATHTQWNARKIDNSELT